MASAANLRPALALRLARLAESLGKPAGDRGVEIGKRHGVIIAGFDAKWLGGRRQGTSGLRLDARNV